MKKYFGIGLALVLVACATVPYTKRHQFNLVSQEQEDQLGLQAYDEVLKKTPLSHNQEDIRRVRTVGEKIAAAAAKPDFKWEFNVLASDQVNAFCLPGGKVAFYEGIMPITKDENGIAVVMGHEVSHALARHGGERMSQTLGAQLVADILATGLGNSSPGVQQAVMQVYGVGAQVGVLLPFGRRQESEADHIGLILMAKAGYDPRTAVGFWRRMSAQGKDKKPPEFLSTHPSDEKRIQQIEKEIPEALKYYKPR